MIHLCTIATLMFLQNNTSQKILFFAARTIQFPGVVFKVCIYLIFAIVTSSLYFDVKSTHTYRKYIYQQSSVSPWCAHGIPTERIPIGILSVGICSGHHHHHHHHHCQFHFSKFFRIFHDGQSPPDPF